MKPIDCETCEGSGKVLEFRPGRHPDDACEEEVDCPDCEGSGSFENLEDDGPSDAEIDDAQNAWESRNTESPE